MANWRKDGWGIAVAATTEAATAGKQSELIGEF